MSARNERLSGWFRLSSAFYLDPKILKVSGGAELLFVRMLALTDATNAAGTVTAEQVMTIRRGIRDIAKTCNELVDANLIVRVGAVHEQCADSAATVRPQRANSAAVVQEQCGSSAATVHQQCTDSAVVVHDFAITGYNRWKPMTADERSESPAQRPSVPAPASRLADRPHARGPAREKTDRQTDRTESSPASPDGLDSVARAAPRLGGAEPQPALNTREDQMPDQRQKPGPGVFLGAVDDRQGDGDSLVGLEHLTGPALAKAALAKAIANGSRPIRLPVRMSKYPKELYAILETEKADDVGDEE